MLCDRYTKYYISHGAVCLFRSRRRHGVHGAPRDWGMREGGRTGGREGGREGGKEGRREGGR